MTVLVLTVVLVLLIAIGMPIALALLATGIVLMAMVGFFDSQLVAQNMLAGADNFPLMAVPFFLLAGELMNAGGMSRRIVDFAAALVGHLKGGLGYVAIAAALLLASISGSALADTAALASILIPMMRRHGYDVAHSGGLIAAGGIIAPIIPPSIAFIVFGVATNLSITSLFLAGIAPGIMAGIALVATWTLIARGGTTQRSPRQGWGRRARAFREAAVALLLPVIIIGGLRGGVFTPTEAAVVAAAYALIVSLIVYREIGLADLERIFVNAAKTTAVVMFLVAAALVSAYMITLADVPGEIVRLLEPMLERPKLLMAAMMALLIAIGMAMDLTPTILIFAPVMMPLAKAAGIDPIYFGVMFVINCSIGLITPPVGTVLNVLCGVARMPMTEAIRGTMPFLAAYLALLALMVAWPELITQPFAWLR